MTYASRTDLTVDIDVDDLRARCAHRACGVPRHQAFSADIVGSKWAMRDRAGGLEHDEQCWKCVIFAECL